MQSTHMKVACEILVSGVVSGVLGRGVVVVVIWLLVAT